MVAECRVGGQFWCSSEHGSSQGMWEKGCAGQRIRQGNIQCPDRQDREQQPGKKDSQGNQVDPSGKGHKIVGRSLCAGPKS